MLVDSWNAVRGPGKLSPRAQHFGSELRDLVGRHAVEIDGHRHRRHLVVGDRARSKALNKEADLFVSQFLMISLGGNQGCGQHSDVPMMRECDRNESGTHARCLPRMPLIRPAGHLLPLPGEKGHIRRCNLSSQTTFRKRGTPDWRCPARLSELRLSHQIAFPGNDIVQNLIE